MEPHENEPEKKIEIEKKFESEKTHSSGSFETLKEHANIDSVIGYAKTHTQDTIAYILLLIGILMSAFGGFYGDLLVGLVAGFYFSKEIVDFVKGYERFIEKEGIPCCLILAGTLFTLFLSSPGIFIGAILMAFLRSVIQGR